MCGDLAPLTEERVRGSEMRDPENIIDVDSSRRLSNHAARRADSRRSLSFELRMHGRACDAMLTWVVERVAGV